ncbi:SpoIID/LytB domain-containing protein [Deinococcus maricopensis]|uniref:SpoIID/LytB domain protein n=1 Tax=Deinococcus maricopensis (strain DSM 21211 / LMG 22137 / NRRL B-23946 / LB-34) TaxID=709986 RepID=E8UC68_DEIML|nr:SpoIID/LytB domain-containing protein [Deinococcus maricopensis]ADV68729.1 SpoIID/LytB domain protein [Deinococcus maricopensis DSM 21211]
MRAPLFLRALRPLALLAALGAGAAHAVNIRVLVASAPQLTVRTPLTNAALPGTTAQPAGATEWVIGVRGRNLTVGGQDSGSDALYLPPAANSTLEIAGRTYRGGVQLRAVNGGVQAVNVVDMEAYLRGVVPAEMPASWPQEALKAQAVIARTYAASRVNPNAPYDVCATEQCQVYGGVAREANNSDAAINATAGQVVSYAGRAAKTFFSSDSGGFTASSAEVWGEALPYLVAKADPASQGPKSQWSMSVPYPRVAEVAARYGVRVGRVTGVQVTRASASGRPQELTLTGTSGTARLAGADAGGFVRSLGAYSTRVTFTPGADALLVAGAGSGHGVGLSQYGASGLAQQAWTHLQILGFYYPGASISALLGVAGKGPLLADTVPLNDAARLQAFTARHAPAPLTAVTPTLHLAGL